MKNPIKTADLGVPPFQETSIDSDRLFIWYYVPIQFSWDWLGKIMLSRENVPKLTNQQNIIVLFVGSTQK